MLRTSLQAWLSRNVEGPLEDLAGGKSRLRIIVMLACILAPDGAFPPIDAARLDVMHSRLWGRAEGVRSTIMYLAQAASPPRCC